MGPQAITCRVFRWKANQVRIMRLNTWSRNDNYVATCRYLCMYVCEALNIFIFVDGGIMRVLLIVNQTNNAY
jgi:hypothetical protein